MIQLQDCILLGTFAKTHGIRGELILRLVFSDFEDIQLGEPVFVEIDKLPVPFFIDDYRFTTANELIVKLEDVDTRDYSANELAGCRVWIEKRFLNMRTGTPPPYDFEALIGFTVTDSKLGKLGRLAEIIDNEQNPLLQVMHKNNEILIPFQPQFILNIDERKQLITVSVPEGLLAI